MVGGTARRKIKARDPLLHAQSTVHFTDTNHVEVVWESQITGSWVHCQWNHQSMFERNYFPKEKKNSNLLFVCLVAEKEIFFLQSMKVFNGCPFPLNPTRHYTRRRSGLLSGNLPNYQFLYSNLACLFLGTKGFPQPMTCDEGEWVRSDCDAQVAITHDDSLFSSKKTIDCNTRRWLVTQTWQTMDKQMKPLYGAQV